MKTKYPESPGYKKPGTSKAAADSMKKKAPSLCDAVVAALHYIGEMTADETAETIEKSVLSIRPRFTELLALGKIADTGRTRPNGSGREATVWRAA